jgi:hypothetical protein
MALCKEFRKKPPDSNKTELWMTIQQFPRQELDDDQYNPQTKFDRVVIICARNLSLASRSRAGTKTARQERGEKQCSSGSYKNEQGDG